MNEILPTRHTRQPDRAGLSHYEIVADGLVHAAAVFDITQDERFVERVATLAWANGVQLAKRDLRRASNAARLLGESLEVGRSESLRLCESIFPFVDRSEDPFGATRSYYREHHDTRHLDSGDPTASRHIRQLIGEAVLAGLRSPGLAPALHDALARQSDKCRHEQVFLTTRVWYWSHKSGLPIDHPFLELAAAFYRNRPSEEVLLCKAVSVELAKVVDRNNPWDLENWLMPGWVEGSMGAKFEPYGAERFAAEVPEWERSLYLEIFERCIVGTATPVGHVDMPAAFSLFISEWNLFGFCDKGIRGENPRELAACAFDFAFRMGLIAELPVYLGGKRTDK